MKDRTGFTLLELLVATTILALLATLAVPPLRQQIAQHRVRLAAAEVASALWAARGSAVRYGVAVAIRFEFEDSHAEPVFSLYADGDGDGVRTADLNSGTDPRIGRPARLLHVGRGVRFGIPDDLEPAEFTGSGRLDRLDDPVRFGRSDIASFSPAGTASPGTVFLTDGYHLFAVRVYSRTGKIQVLRYVRDREFWKGV
ncbi:MAG: prepilin-type N-terminal cleavage/methylation domain-containing protein [Acidobacteria bacterium]|nr:prepilin-type N-terminal cleavage/methylation domain-containing protein [Acidobacteriota bacterium]